MKYREARCFEGDTDADCPTCNRRDVRPDERGQGERLSAGNGEAEFAIDYVRIAADRSPAHLILPGTECILDRD